MHKFSGYVKKVGRKSWAAVVCDKATGRPLHVTKASRQRSKVLSAAARWAQAHGRGAA